jgi:hypothetical protein
MGGHSHAPSFGGRLASAIEIPTPGHDAPRRRPVCLQVGIEKPGSATARTVPVVAIAPAAVASFQPSVSDPSPPPRNGRRDSAARRRARPRSRAGRHDAERACEAERGKAAQHEVGGRDQIVARVGRRVRKREIHHGGKETRREDSQNSRLSPCLRGEVLCLINAHPQRGARSRAPGHRRRREC